MFALIGVVQVQLLAIIFLAWLNFSWLGLAAASAIWLGSFCTLSLVDELSNRIFRNMRSYDLRIELIFRVAVQAVLIAGVIWLCDIFIPQAAAASWVNPNMPYAAALFVSSTLVSVVCTFMQLLELPVVFKDLRDYLIYR